MRWKNARAGGAVNSAGRDVAQDPLARYDAMTQRCAAEVMAAYSTSFSAATRLLTPRVRDDIRNLYAMVRIADEIVDGAAGADGAEAAAVDAQLRRYEEQVLAAPATRLHTDPVLHAYAITARRCAFDPEHIRAFFASMRADVAPQPHDAASLDRYIYGSAEVIGQLCLSVFLADERQTLTQERQSLLEDGACSLGAAFQKINFLRDVAEDSTALGRGYFASPQERLSEEHKADIIADIRRDFARAYAAIPLLPLGVRAGVLAAADLFAALTDIIAAQPVEELYRTRASVPAWAKARIVARAVARAPRLRATAAAQSPEKARR